MSIPKDTTGQDVSQDVWYWAANSDGVAGAGKFIISNGGATFFINGSEYQAESFTTFARCENPEAKVHPHRQLFANSNYAIQKCCRRIATCHDPVVRNNFKADEYFLRQNHHLLKWLLEYLDNHDATDSKDTWMELLLGEIESAVEIYREVECPNCGPRKAEVNQWRGYASIGGTCCGCGTRINWESTTETHPQDVTLSPK